MNCIKFTNTLVTFKSSINDGNISSLDFHFLLISPMTAMLMLVCVHVLTSNVPERGDKMFTLRNVVTLRNVTIEQPTLPHVQLTTSRCVTVQYDNHLPVHRGPPWFKYSKTELKGDSYSLLAAPNSCGKDMGCAKKVLVFYE